MKDCLKYLLIVVAFVVLSPATAVAGDGPYLLELGLQGGINYYVGDANQHIFMHPREVYGAQFRYKFDRRWALQVKGQGARYGFKYPVEGAGFEPDPNATPEVLNNRMIMLDAVGEFNFFRFGEGWRDWRVKSYTPYIFLGIGTALYGGRDGAYSSFAAYLPLGIGFKWNFAPHCSLHTARQHNLFFADNIEGVEEYDNVAKLNGSNILNCDLTGSFTVGLVFDFLEAKKVCRTCDW